MVSPGAIFWEVDVQADFMLPGGKLYVSGAERLVENINALVEAARRGQVFLISSADAHNEDDSELKQWPPHCLKGTAGAALLPEATAAPHLVIPNRKDFVLPERLEVFRQLTLEKNTLDVFDNPNTDRILDRLRPGSTPAFRANPLFVVFGVATEYCVRCTAEGLLNRGRIIAIVKDAIRAIEEDKGREIIERLCKRGARLITTQDALMLVRKAE